MEAKSRRDDTILTFDKRSAVGGDSNRQHQTSTNMTKHLSIQKVLATLLTIVAVFAGQQAFATITSPMSLTGNSALMNGQYYHVWKTEGFLGNYSQPRTQGSSYTFNGQNIGLQGGDVRITGTLNFTESNDFTDVTTGSTVTVEFYSTNFWFFNAEVKKLDGTSVSGCSYSASSDHSSITVTIPSGKTFGNIYLGYSVHPQMTESNTTISGIEASYIYQGSAIRPQPTVVYTNPNLSQTTLTLNTDYTLSYTNNNGPGIATVIITGAGEYAGTLTRTYTIRNIDLSDFNSLGNNTYEIANKDDLDHLALLVDVAANNCQGLTFKQTADITYSHGSSTTENNFTQIGGYFGGDKNFSGTYDGQNHTISGIRVYKSPTNSGNENKNVALFGRISGATIQNVILTDARITGYRYVGGLVGNKASGTVQNCLIVGSTITCGNTYGGALFGNNNGTLTANYYRNCTVNNTTNATNVGVGNGSSSSDMAGARSVHPLTIQNANITATGESVAYQGTTYYASNTQITLGYNNLPAGYTLTYTLNGTALSGNTFTMPANDNATVTATATLITYNITYDLDGGSVATANPTTYNVTTPTFTLNNPTKAGYTFTGWTGSNGTTPQTEVTIAQGSTGNLNYTAHWSLDTYNITYDLDGGSVATANPTTYNVTTPTFTLTNPTKAACTFDGWTGSNGNTPQTMVTIAQGSTGNLNYTAHWSQYAFTLTLGTNITASGTVAFTLDGTDYYAAGTEITLAYSGNNPEGQHLIFKVNGTPIANNGNTFAMPAANATVSVAFCYWPGSGTENDPFIISTTTELDLLAQNVNSGNSYVGKFFKLGADIAYDPNVLDANGENYTTIGIYNQHIFIGSFDGDGHTISGIRSSQGLFAVIHNYDECSFDDNVKNVTLADAVITGNDYIGGIVGENMYGHIKNCKVINTVINGGIVVGGIVGHNDYSHRISIEDCQVINTVINGNLAIGGIAGWLDFGQIESCQVINTDINGAQALGGIAGLHNGGSIENCLALDTDITATQQPNPYSGAIVGSTNSTLTSNYYHGCTMNNETSGIGTENGDITENDGAMQVFSLSLGGNVTATPAPVVTYNGTDYYFAGTTITLVYGGTIPSGCSLVYSVNGNAIEGNSFEMPTQDVAVTLTKQGLRYTYNSSTGALALIWGDFNKNNKWGSEVTATAVTSVTATNDVSFTGNCYNLFYNFTNCTSMELGNVNTDALNNMYCMFWGCSSLTTLDLSGWNTANVTNMSYMFIRSTSLQSLNLSGWNTANVTDMSWMFQQCSSLQSLSLSGWNTANVTQMSSMFQQCSSLQSLNVSGWNTANVTNMYYMFDGCSGLQSLNVSGWNTANVTQMSSMFQQCSSLQSLSLTGWNTSNVKNMSYMFRGCSGLQSLDLSGWNTTNVTDMSWMFEQCSSLQSLDLTGWSTANVTNMSGMFYGCSGLTTIYAGEGWNTYNVWDMSDMFEDCTSLVGGMGTTYDADHTDGEYARIDGGSERPGYFTGRFTKEIAGYEDNESGWYLIASPLAADIAPTAVTNMTNETFDLYCFDQTGGNNGKEWKNWKNEGGDGYHFNLEAGKGYLYANSGDVTLMFAGTPYDGDGVVNLTYSTDNPNATMHGWNLIGNPFSTNATIGDTPFYRMNAAGSEIIAADVNDNTVNPMEGIFVKATQANQTVTFETAMTRGNANSNSAALVMDISQNRGGVIDRAIVRFGEGQTLPKFQIHENSTKVYIPQDGTDYAVAVIASDSEAIQPTEQPIHFKAAENGTYTLTISTTFNSQLSTVNYLHLIDNLTGADVDLLVPNGGDARPCVSTYTFTAKTTDYESRFKLVFAVGSSTGSDTFAFISNGNIIVNGEGTLQIFDAMGRQLFSKELSTFNSQLSTLNYTPGVYVLRLINGENVRTQKIVIE